MQKILAVDDEEVVCNLIKEVLQYAGYEVQIARNGKEASQLLQEHLPDLLITDIAMPEKPGNTLIEEVCGQHPDLPIIAISGAATLQPGIFLRIAKELGATYILAKPFDPEELVRLVGKALDRRSAAERLAT